MQEPQADDEHPQVYPKDLNRQIHGLRGLATLLVFVYHLYGVGSLWGFWPTNLDPLAPLLIAGRHGVEIFFVISGYLITGSLLRHRDAGRFLIDRCIRIYPVFLAIHVLVFTLGPAIGYKWMAHISPVGWLLDFAENALFLPGILNLPLAQLNAWSLSYEAAFYLASAAIYVVARAFGRPAALIVFILAMIPVLYHYPLASFFVVGVAVFFLAARHGTAVPAAVRHLSIPALLVALGGMTISEYSAATCYLASLPCFLLFWSLVEGRCALSAFLRGRWLQYLGTISYSFYLWSPVVTYPMKLAIDRYLLGRVDPLTILLAFAVLGLAASLAVSQLSFIILEDRAGRLLRTRLRKTRTLPAPA